MTDLKLNKLIQSITEFAKEEGMTILVYKGDEMETIPFVSLNLEHNEIYFGTKKDFIEQCSKPNIKKVIKEKEYFELDYVPSSIEIQRLRDLSACSIKQAIDYLTKAKGDMDLAREIIRKTYLK
jgi:hypothetical protein